MEESVAPATGDPEKLLPVNVWLAGRSYRILIPPAEEAVVRRSVKGADQKISELRQHYAGKDDQDFVAMALLMYATENKANAGTSLDEEAIEAMIAKIDRVLGES